MPSARCWGPERAQAFFLAVRIGSQCSIDILGHFLDVGTLNRLGPPSKPWGLDAYHSMGVIDPFSRR